MKTIKLSVEQAKELYNTNKEFRNTILHEFTDAELGIEPLLRDLEDLVFDRAYIKDITLGVPTEKHYISVIAFAKLSMLMADLDDECNVDWGDDNEAKYTIERKGNSLSRYWYYSGYHFLAFKTQSIRDAFLEKHERLIKDYFMID